MTNLLIAGATGLVGAQVLALALADDRINLVVAPTRRPVARHPKLQNPIVDFERLPLEADWWSVDTAICALGTTRAAAGSTVAYRRVDHDYPLAIAQRVGQAGGTRFTLVSSMGANARSNFRYTRMKGELEDAVRRLSFPSLTIVRPGLLGGDRDEFRAAERIGGLILHAIGPTLPLAWRISRAEIVARALIEAAIAGRPGETVIGSAQLAALAAA